MTATAKIGILVQAENMASKALKAITGDLDDMGDEAERTSKRMAGLKNTMGIGLKVAGAAAAAGVAAVGAVMVSSVRMAADAEEAQSKFNVVFSDTAGTAALVTSEMDKFAKASGRNKYMLREMAAGFGDVLKPMGFSVEEAGGLSQEMTKLAIDLGSFNNMRPEEAFERLSSTLIGNHANALSFGVIINEAILKEELMAMGADELSGALLEQAKVQARINILMRGTTDAQGDAVRTGDSWTNTMLRLNSVIDEQRTALGLRLLPVFTPILAAFTDLAEIYIPKAADALANWVENIDVEKVKADLALFFKGLETGTLITPTVYIDFKPKEGSWISPDGAGGWNLLIGQKREVSFGDFFTWKNVKGEGADGEQSFNILEFFGIGSESIIIDGVEVKNKAKIGQLIEGEWTADDGFTVFKIGGIDISNFVDSTETVMAFYANLGRSAKSAFVAAFKGPGTSSEFDETGGAFAERPAWLSDLGLISSKIQVAFETSGESVSSKLSSIVWPNFPVFVWPNYVEWLWPEYSLWDWSAYEYSDWTWPDYLTWAWPDLPAWNWPGKPSWWKWPTNTPNWISTLRDILDNFNPFGGGNDGPVDGGSGQDDPGYNPAGGPGQGAVGKGFTLGGRMLVGETGPELVTLPRGSQIYPHGQTMQMAGAGMGANITINATVNNEMDAHVLARQIANIIQRGGY